jgi:hypothetical protein
MHVMMARMVIDPYSLSSEHVEAPKLSPSSLLELLLGSLSHQTGSQVASTSACTQEYVSHPQRNRCSIEL